jgi:uncharacterized membrane protein YdbT with pleckstrin-like domain
MGPFLEKISFKVIISDDRISIIQGLLSKSVIDIPKSKIECININQSLLGRLLDYGDISIIGSGGTKEELTDIAHPFKLKKELENS